MDTQFKLILVVGFILGYVAFVVEGFIKKYKQRIEMEDESHKAYCQAIARLHMQQLKDDEDYILSQKRG